MARIEILRAHDPEAAELEMQLLAAAIHGDSPSHPDEAYAALLAFAQKAGFPLPAGTPVLNDSTPKDTTPRLRDEPEKPAPKLRWQPPKTPLALLRRLQAVVHGKEVKDAQLLEYCAGPLVAWADSHQSEVIEIVTIIARANRFDSRLSLLSGLAEAFEKAGKKELAARALTFTFSGHRGGGGWLSFGDEKNEDLLVRAFAASREVAVAVLAQEMAFRIGNWGVTRHVIGFFGRHDDVALAVSMWDEARESMLVRLPGNGSARGPFLALEPAHVPAWSREDAALFLILARISHPERRRKTAAICGAAWLVQREPAKCIAAFRGILSASLCYTHQLWVLQLLGQFEPSPFVISQALAAELNEFVRSGRCGTEQVALMLLRRADLPVTRTVTRAKPLVTVTVRPDEQKAILSIDRHDVVSKVADYWPEFPEIVAARFQTIVRSDESHKERIGDRWDASRSIARKSYPRASIHPWEVELFTDSLHEVLTGLEAYLFAKGEWDDRVWPDVLSWLLPDAEMPARHYWSRRVRPSWPLPSALRAGVQPVQTVPDGEFSGWSRIGYFETYLDLESRLDEIKLKTRVTAGVVLGEKVAPLSPDVLPIRMASNREWMRKARPLFPLGGFSGGVAGHLHFGAPFVFHELLGLARGLPSTMNLSGREHIGPLDLLDADGNIAVAYRWWQVRPVGNHGFAEEAPRLFGGALLMRPDVFQHFVTTTKLQAFEAIAVKAQTTAELISDE